MKPVNLRDAVIFLIAPSFLLPPISYLLQKTRHPYVPVSLFFPPVP
ncbi:MAG: hypothetical protein ACRC10_07455 [Thermoguttaceae bacterium]